MQIKAPHIYQNKELLQLYVAQQPLQYLCAEVSVNAELKQWLSSSSPSQCTVGSVNVWCDKLVNVLKEITVKINQQLPSRRKQTCHDSLDE